MNEQDLDNFITGHYGQDEFIDQMESEDGQ